MDYTQDDLDLANARIQRAESLVIQQQRIIDALHDLGQSTAMAEKLVARMQAGIATLYRERDVIEAQLNGPDADERP